MTEHASTLPDQPQTLAAQMTGAVCLLVTHGPELNPENGSNISANAAASVQGHADELLTTLGVRPEDVLWESPCLHDNVSDTHELPQVRRLKAVLDVATQAAVHGYNPSSATHNPEEEDALVHAASNLARSIAELATTPQAKRDMYYLQRAIVLRTLAAAVERRLARGRSQNSLPTPATPDDTPSARSRFEWREYNRIQPAAVERQPTRWAPVLASVPIRQFELPPSYDAGKGADPSRPLPGATLNFSITLLGRGALGETATAVQHPRRPAWLEASSPAGQEQPGPVLSLRLA